MALRDCEFGFLFVFNEMRLKSLQKCVSILLNDYFWGDKIGHPEFNNDSKQWFSPDVWNSLHPSYWWRRPDAYTAR